MKIHNNRKTTKGRKIQQVLSEVKKLFKDIHLTAKGKRLKAQGAPKDVLDLYTKNRYQKNTNSQQIKQIIHNV